MDPLKRSQTDDAVHRLLSAWELLRTQHREIPAQAVTVFLYVASHNPCHKQAIEEDQELTTASCSRMLSFLTSKTRPGCLYPSGLDLVEKYTDPSNGRRFMVKLTPKGKAILSAIKEIIYD
tara:strand:+ start:480 stop:842 length:363 start_codon:yes stop_codon:yes gene_type:complete